MATQETRGETADVRTRIERLDLPAHDGVVAGMIERYKRLQDEGWEVTLLVETRPPEGRQKLRRDTAVVGLAWKR